MKAGDSQWFSESRLPTNITRNLSEMQILGSIQTSLVRSSGESPHGSDTCLLPQACLAQVCLVLSAQGLPSLGSMHKCIQHWPGQPSLLGWVVKCPALPQWVSSEVCSALPPQSPVRLVIQILVTCLIIFTSSASFPAPHTRRSSLRVCF